MFIEIKFKLIHNYRCMSKKYNYLYFKNQFNEIRVIFKKNNILFQ